MVFSARTHFSFDQTNRCRNAQGYWVQHKNTAHRRSINMKAKARFTNSIIDTAAKTEVQMPWARGARRAAMIARRKGQPLLRQVKTA